MPAKRPGRSLISNPRRPDRAQTNAHARAALRNILGLRHKNCTRPVSRRQTHCDPVGKLVQLAEQMPDIVELKIIIEAEEQRLIQARTDAAHAQRRSPSTLERPDRHHAERGSPEHGVGITPTGRSAYFSGRWVCARAGRRFDKSGC